MSKLHEVAERLGQAKRVLLTSHISPDGDSIGSLLALGLSLRAQGVAVTMFSFDVIPYRYRFLSGVDQIITSSLPDSNYDYTVILDSSDPLRVEPVWPQIKDTFIINIDHHPTNTYYGTLNYVDPAAAATGEIVYELLRIMDEKINLEISEALYTAIASDTGSFKYENTTSRTHHIAASLLSEGVKPATISARIFDTRTKEATFILSRALSSLEFHLESKVAGMVITEEDVRQSGAEEGDAEGVINFAKNIEGIEVGMLFRIQGEKIKVGFRSREIDVGRLAASLGGGGHARAAGCTMSGSLVEVRGKILDLLKSELSSLEGKQSR